jgi:hypothetical protein
LSKRRLGAQEWEWGLELEPESGPGPGLALGLEAVELAVAVEFALASRAEAQGRDLGYVRWSAMTTSSPLAQSTLKPEPKVGILEISPCALWTSLCLRDFEGHLLNSIQLENGSVTSALCLFGTSRRYPWIQILRRGMISTNGT